jgi:hypothetical protein
LYGPDPLSVSVPFQRAILGAQPKHPGLPLADLDP